MNFEVLPSEYHSRLTLDRADVFGENSFLSKSSVWELYQSSLYKWRYYPRQHTPSDAMTWGSLVDCLVTTPEDFEGQFVISEYDSYRSEEAREWRDNTIAEGKSIVTQDLIDKATKAAQNLTERHKVSAEIIERSQKQVVIVKRIKHPAVDRAFNIKALLDFAPEGKPYLCDLKTIHDFTPSGFEKAIAKFGYHVQASHYLSSWNLQNPNDQRDRFRIIWQDYNAPYEVAVTELPAVDIADGSDLFNHLLGKILRHADKDWWPMRFEKPILLSRAMFGTYQEGQEIDGYVTAPETEPNRKGEAA